MSEDEYKYLVSVPIDQVDRLTTELARRSRPEHKVEIKLTEALQAAAELGNEVNRLWQALGKIRFAANQANATAIWMQKVAAHAMDPEQWPEPPAEPPR